MSEEISREALLIYLDNLRTMETIKYESEKKKEWVKNKSEKSRPKLLIDREEPRRPIKPELAPEKRLRDDTKYITKIVFVIIFIGFAVFSFYSACSINPNPNPVTLMSLAFLIIGIVHFIQAYNIYKKVRTANNENYAAWKEKIEKYRVELEKYEVELEEYKIELKNSREDFDKSCHEFDEKVSDRIGDLSRDINRAENLLKKAYSANIIPQTFRNIHGIYYLYDYLSTSNQSLSEALIQCNLESIKQKLDRMIELQGKAIIDQAIAHKALYEQNQQILEAARATAINTAVTAQYAKICALNSAILVDIQSKSLAYQKAEFWLR